MAKPFIEWSAPRNEVQRSIKPDHVKDRFAIMTKTEGVVVIDNHTGARAEVANHAAARAWAGVQAGFASVTGK